MSARPVLRTPHFNDVYEAHFDLVWRNLCRMGLRPPVIDDALQDVFLVVHRRWADFEQRSTLKTWIIGITLRVASDYLRRAKRQRLRFEDLDVELRDPRIRDPSDATADRQTVQLLYAALAELDEKQRAAFILSEIEELSALEVSAIVGSSPNTVSSRLRAARRKFTRALQRLRAKDISRWAP